MTVLGRLDGDCHALAKATREVASAENNLIIEGSQATLITSPLRFAKEHIITVREMRVSYQVMDPVVLFLPETQAREALFTEVAEGQIRSPRVSVIPQAEGRSYLGVLVEIDTDEGLWTRAASIPIQVGNVRAEPRLNGELQTDEQGEAVISMPARED